MDKDQFFSKVNHVVIMGAGPAGCMAALLLLQRSANYKVTLVDSRPNPLDIPLAQQRSWMMGLSAHGMKAINRITGLRASLEDVFLASKGVCIHFGSKSVHLSTGEEGVLVDRCWLVAAMLKHLLTASPGRDRLTCLWSTQGLHVDVNAHCITLLAAGQPQTLSYDVLLGCDGIRSVVRDAFLKQHGFEFQMIDAFGKFKSIHLPRPPAAECDVIHLTPFAIPNMNSAFLPACNGMTNFCGGYNLNKVCAPEFFSNDAAVVAAYLKSHCTAPLGLDWQQFAEEWVKQSWCSVSLVKCSTYHHQPGCCLLMGDAAHATSPVIGQGMNTALDDAAQLDALLDRYEDNWEVVLPAYTAVRLKEGHALVELSAHNFPLDSRLLILVVLWQAVQAVANRLTGGIIPPYPVHQLAHGKPLSQVYQDMTKYGPLCAARNSNLAIRLQWFERHSGLCHMEQCMLLRTFTAMVSAIVGLVYAVSLIVILPFSMGLDLCKSLHYVMQNDLKSSQEAPPSKGPLD